MHYSCKVCGRHLVRVNGAKRCPEKCSDCTSAHCREQQRQWRERVQRPARAAKWLNAKCESCGRSVATEPRRGPIPKRCDSCSETLRREYNTKRRGSGADKIHSAACKQCGVVFSTARKKQGYCSPECGHLASRSRSQIACQRCGSQFEIDSSRAETRRFCSWDCWIASKPSHEKTCVGCGQSFTRSVNGKMPHQDKGKYCSRECYLDHRWGTNRPRRVSSKSAIDTACRRALATSLRKRCKRFGVPFDPACTREAVCERDGWVCQQCGVKCHKGRHRFNKRTRKMSKQNAEHDHIVPLSWGEPTKGNTFDNSQCLCRACNGRKKNRGGGQMRLNLVEC